MKFLSITFAFFILLSTNAQDIQLENNKKLALGLVFSPNYSFRTLSTTDEAFQDFTSYRDETETSKIGYTSGLSFLISASKRITIETGILYSNKGEKTTNLGLIFQGPEPLAPISVKRVYNYYYAEIPAKINYKLTTGKASLFVSVGGSTNIFLQQTTKSIITYTDGSTQKNTSEGNDLSRIQFSGLASLGIDYAFNDGLKMRIEPIYRRALIPIIDAPIKQYTYSIGCNFGVYKMF